MTPLTASRPDEELQVEMDLCTALWIACSDSGRSLTQDEVDRLLGAL